MTRQLAELSLDEKDSGVGNRHQEQVFRRFGRDLRLSPAQKRNQRYENIANAIALGILCLGVFWII